MSSRFNRTPRYFFYCLYYLYNCNCKIASLLDSCEPTGFLRAHRNCEATARFAPRVISLRVILRARLAARLAAILAIFQGVGHCIPGRKATIFQGIFSCRDPGSNPCNSRPWLLTSLALGCFFGHIQHIRMQPSD
jgi:hypothetical protein